MKLQILLFGGLKDAAKASQIAVEAPEGADVAQILEICAIQFPNLQKWLPHVRVAVNQEYAFSAQILAENDEIALVPPVSGGSGLIAVVEREISLEEVVRAVADENCGAVCTFLGLVRRNSRDLEGREHHDIEFLDYEAYAPMAERKMAAIAAHTEANWGAKCAILHRVGRLKVGEASVAIAVASPHRAESFEACRFAIETLKKDVPVWKKETARDGFWWVEGAGG